MSDLTRLLDPDYLGLLAERPVEEIRAMRADCVRVETELSYFRRLVQGRLDIVASEQERRRHGDDPTGLPELIGQLPEIFSEQRRPGGAGRLPQSIDAPEVDLELATTLDELAGPSVLSGLPGEDDAAVAALASELSRLEHTVSGYRQQLFDCIDALQAELTDRYRTGEASVDALLADS
jgi:hypothetical protein